MIYSIDTESMRQICELGNTIALLVEESAVIANSIASHTDWNCKEKRAINNYISQFKNELNRMQEETMNFSARVSVINQEIEDFQAECLLSARGLDIAFSKCFSIPTADAVLPSQVMVDNLSATNSVYAYNRFDNYELASMGEALQICPFNKIDLGE